VQNCCVKYSLSCVMFFQGVFGASTLEALEEAVRKYKIIARQVEPHTDYAKDIIRRLVQLRMKLFQAKVQHFTWV